MLYLTSDNYFSTAANEAYLSVSQYKDFMGSYGKTGCEEAALARLHGEWEQEVTVPMMVGSYVDAYFEGTLDAFREKNPQMFKRDGSLKADFVKAEEAIRRAERDRLFMKYMSGEKQVIMTGKIGGAPWKCKIDSYIPGKAIVDLKVMQSLTKMEWVKDLGYLDFVRYWGYDIQGAVYQEIVRQNTGERLPFYIAGISKEKEPDIEVIHVANVYLDEALSSVEGNVSRIIQLKNGEEFPDRCGRCDYCRHTKVLQKPISLADIAGQI